MSDYKKDLATLYDDLLSHDIDEGDELSELAEKLKGLLTPTIVVSLTYEHKPQKLHAPQERNPRAKSRLSLPTQGPLRTASSVKLRSIRCTPVPSSRLSLMMKRMLYSSQATSAPTVLPAATLRNSANRFTNVRFAKNYITLFCTSNHELAPRLVDPQRTRRQLIYPPTLP